jgi:hypothetical protein
MKRLLRATVYVAVVDFLWAIFLSWEGGNAPMEVWKGVASVGFGAEIRSAGWRAIAIGLGMHVGTAFTWSLLFVTAEHNIGALRRFIAKPVGVAVTSALYGPFIWMMMSGVVIPTLTGNPLTIRPRWYLQLAGHAVFVGLPIVLGARSAGGTGNKRTGPE